MKLFAGNSNRVLAEQITKYLNIPLGKASVRRFADQEIFVEIQENVRGEDCFVLQSTSYPANDNLMELLIMIDALMRSSARRITAVLPYFGYARQDRKPGPRTPISAKLVANMITKAGADRVLTLDLHAGADPGLLRHPDRQSVFRAGNGLGRARELQRSRTSPSSRPMSAAWCAPARSPSASRRSSPSSTSAATGPGESEVMNVIGDVRGNDCMLIDDIVDSGGTLCNAADALLNKGATSRDRLHHPRRAVRRRGGAHHRIQAEGTGHHQFHPADRRNRNRSQHPRRVRRRTDRRGDPAHGVGKIRVEPVRLDGHQRQDHARRAPPPG